MSGVVASYEKPLTELRDSLNQKFKLMQASKPMVDAGLFFETFRRMLEQVLPTDPGFAQDPKAKVLIEALFTTLAELTTSDPLHSRPATHASLNSILRAAPACSSLLKEKPKLVLALIANAAANLSEQPEARLEDFSQVLARAISLRAEEPALRSFLIVSAWVSGYAALRQEAIVELRKFRDEEARVFFPSAVSAQKLAEDLGKSPWIDREGKLDLSLRKRVGGYFGFGGKFLHPPAVEAGEFSYLISDGLKRYRLFADVFGSSWLSYSGELKNQAWTNSLAEFDDALCVSANSHTMIVSLESSFEVTLLPRSS